MASSSGDRPGSSGDRPGTVEVWTGAARALADMWRTVADFGNSVGPEADNSNEAMRDAVAATKAFENDTAEVFGNDTARVSAAHRYVNRLCEGQANQRGVKRPFEGQAQPPALDWLELSVQNELQRFYRTNPGDAPPIIPGRVYYLLAPGVHPMEDLANPGRELEADCASYRLIESNYGFTIRVMIKKNAS